MKLKRFKKNNKRIIMIIIAVATLIGLVVSITRVMSHAYFKITKSFNIIQGKIPNKSGDVKLAVFVGEDKYKGEGFPPKENYKFKSYECTNGVTLIWDPVEWQANLSVKTPTVCTLKFEAKDEYEEEILKGSYPVIKDELVPVVIADNGEVTKADIKDEWYSYENNRWANAVILTGTDNYQVGQTIPEEAIESYFVWIPKYRYKLKSINTNNTTPSVFDIEFNSDNTINSSTECIAPNTSGESGSCDKDKWMTHPAFQSIDDSEDNNTIKGIWVGKFETGYKETMENYNVTAPEKIQIKPNVNSWRGINISNAYNTSFNYKRGLDSHMMKNTEWGAFVYLTNSKYGRPKDENGIPTEIWINNSSSYTTGCAGSSLSASNYRACQNAWNTSNGYHASTTNNISGIYDTSGGAWDMVMGNLNSTTSSSGFPTDLGIASKYYDKYTGENTSARILGDATLETYGWNGDWTNFVNSSSPWFYRGGHCIDSTAAGVFLFTTNAGGVNPDASFRIVLSPTN